MINAIFKKSTRILIIFLILIFFFCFVKSYVDYSLYQYHVKEDEVVIIPKGYSGKKIAKLLLEKKIIYDANIFILYTKIKKYFDGSYLIAGEYEIKNGMNTAQIIEKMLSGDIVIHKLTFPEGLLTIDALNIILNAYGIINDLDSKDKLKDQGVIMPETYFYTYGAKASEILNRCSKSLEEFLHHAWNRRDIMIDSILKTKEMALVLASIVEREAKLDNEKQRIASVYFNRLKINMPLQADPTVIFAITEGKSFNLNLSYENLRFKSPYNTYIINGLPPTPICNPGKAAIEAVLHPLNTNEIYFVADGKGGHMFASAFKEHTENIKRYKEAIAHP